MTDNNTSQSLESFITSILKDQIINLDLLPGTKLSEMKIAKLYGCSRAPVRDAFSGLRVTGYLESRPQVGTFVSKINLDKVEEIRFIRESVEVAILDMGIRNNILPAKVPLLNANIKEMEIALTQNNLRRFTELDIMFHNILYTAVGKSFVSKYCGDDDVHYSRLRFMVTRDGESVYTTINEHREILNLISKKKSDGINELVCRHLNNIYKFLDRNNPSKAEMFSGGDYLKL